MKVKWMGKAITSLAAVTLLTPLGTIEACTTVLVGKKASADGSTMIARNEDMGTAWTKRFVVYPAGKNKETKYKSKANGFTTDIPKDRLKVTATPEWDESEGQFDEAGINSAGVAMSGTESAEANEAILKVDPFVETGIAEDSMNAVVLPYIKTAREGVERLGQIVEKEGAAEANGLMFSDKDEIWYMEIGSGHQWVAYRLPDDHYAVVANQLAIETVNFDDSDHFMMSKDLKETAIKAKQYKEGDPFVFEKIYGVNREEDKYYNLPRVWYGQKMLTPSLKQDVKQDDFAFSVKPDKKISVEDVQKVLSAHYQDTEYDYRKNPKAQFRPMNVPHTMESHILQIRPDMPNEIAGIHWLALGVPETSVYVPFYSGITETPKPYQKGTDNISDGGAYWTFRGVDALANFNYETALNELIQPEKDQLIKDFNKDLDKTDKEAMKMKEGKERDEYLTKVSQKRSEKAISAWNTLYSKLMKMITNETKVYHNPKL
ncbi:C69 family dipeptidase [Atopobacter phocae]|uniref:C69 family dipeptidase n=1 Tax=Atopobacter phocae TaxID=136492 RepID=UPI00046EEDE0|nr:C69 family dipeptidase [Atopobacter phocae]